MHHMCSHVYQWWPKTYPVLAPGKYRARLTCFGTRQESNQELIGVAILLGNLTCMLSAEPQLLSWSPSSDRLSSRADFGKYADDLVAPTPRKLLNASVVFLTRTFSEPMRRNPSFSGNDPRRIKHDFYTICTFTKDISVIVIYLH